MRLVPLALSRRRSCTECAHVSRAQLLIPAELAHDTVDALGEVGQLQFKDLNTSKSAFQRTYANQVRTMMRPSSCAFMFLLALMQDTALRAWCATSALGPGTPIAHQHM